MISLRPTPSLPIPVHLPCDDVKTPIPTFNHHPAAMQPPRGPALWLRRARELFSDLQAHAHATSPATARPHTAAPPFRPPDWLRPPWDPPPEYPPPPSSSKWSRSAFRAPPPPRQTRARGSHNACDAPACNTPAAANAVMHQAAGGRPATAAEEECAMQMRNVLRSVAQVSADRGGQEWLTGIPLCSTPSPHR